MRSTYDVKETYTGDGSLAEYTFDFKIEALAQLEIVELDTNDVETQRVRGTDAVYLSGVVFDAVDGGGTVTLAANLTTGYTLLLLLANDDPTQTYQFNNKTTFTLKDLEKALDFLSGAQQRLAYRGKQALRIHDDDNEETFDCQLPPQAPLTIDGRYLAVNAAGDGFEYGFTIAELAALVLPTPSVANEVVKWSGSTWVSALYGGGMVVSATQDIANGADITVNDGIQQLLKVQGDGGPQTTSVTPFTGTLQNGMVITLLGMSDVNILTVQYADIQYGAMLKGDAYLSKGDTLTMVYDSDTERFYETARN